MIRSLLTIYIFLTCTFVFAQGNYYNSLDSNKRCQDLKDALFTHINNNYITKTYDDAWNVLSSYDVYKLDGSEYIWDIYSYVPNGPQIYQYKPGNRCNNDNVTEEGKCWNREHILPSSWFGQEGYAYGDVVNLMASDAFVNNRRSNHPLGKVKTPSFTSRNGSKLGTSDIINVSGNVFEPIDEFKGDVARILLYMSVKYADKFNSWSNTDFNRVKGTDKLMGYKKEYLDMLIQWHEQDPPSQKEIDRNSRVFNHQRNRNPFVDFPQFVNYIWKSDNCKSVGIKNYQANTFNIYPNPATQEINFDHTLAKGQNYFITDISGRNVQNGILNRSFVSVSELTNGTYFLFIEENKQTSYIKFIIAR